MCGEKLCNYGTRVTKTLLNCVYAAFRLVRGLIIDMVLATDMSCHFAEVKNMKNLLSSPDA